MRRYEDVAIIGDLREAIANDRFRMEAQPIVELAHTGGARRFELLLRMIDASGESVAPDKFLTAAERYQLATDIDRWVVQYALEILSSAAPRLASMDAHFAINISGQSLGDEQFPIYLEQKLREYDLPAGMLSFEITETAAVANIVRAEMLIRRLQDLGHSIALDDFGRGLSSLTYLKSLPVSHLKIDGGLVRDLAGNARSRADGHGDRAAVAGDEAGDDGRMRRERIDPRGRRPARRDLWAGFRDRPAAAARDRLAGAVALRSGAARRLVAAVAHRTLDTESLRAKSSGNC